MLNPSAIGLSSPLQLTSLMWLTDSQRSADSQLGYCSGLESPRSGGVQRVRGAPRSSIEVGDESLAVSDRSPYFDTLSY